MGNPGQGGHSMDVNSVCLSCSRGVLYTAGEGFGTRDFMKVWNLKTGELIQDMDGHMEGVFALTKAEELGLLFSASVDRTIRVLDMNTHKCLHVLEEHTDKVRCLYWNAERRELLSGGDELLVWNADDWTVKHKLEGHKLGHLSVCRWRDGSEHKCGQDLQSLGFRGELAAHTGARRLVEHSLCPRWTNYHRMWERNYCVMGFGDMGTQMVFHGAQGVPRRVHREAYWRWQAFHGLLGWQHQMLDSR